MEFKKVKIKEIAEIISGYAFKGKDFGSKGEKTIKITDIKPPYIDLDNCFCVDIKKYNKDLNKFKAGKDDYIIAMTGATIGKIGIIMKDEIAYLNQRTAKFETKEGVLKKYLYYCLLQNEFKTFVFNHIDSESAQPNISANSISEYEINLPNLDNQKKIVNILETIDKKIYLNNQISYNFFEIGIELLKKDYKDSELECLSEVIKFIKGKKPFDIVGYKKELYEKYLTIACLNRQELNYANTIKMIMCDNDVLMVMDGASSGDVYYARYGIVGSTLAKIECFNKKYLPEFVYFLLKYHKDLIQSRNTGSAIPHTDKIFVGSLEIPKISLERQQEYKKLLKKIQQNNEENEILTKLRDILLPKLINGEIDLGKIEN